MASKGGMLLMLLAAVLGVTVAEWHRSNYPNPQDSVNDNCGRKGKKSFVCDPEGIISFTEANQLDKTIERIRNETVCPCSARECHKDRRGYKLAIAIAPKILSDEEMKLQADGENDYEKEYTPMQRLDVVEMFAYTLLRSWKIGRCEEELIIIYDPSHFSLYTVGGSSALKQLDSTTIAEITVTNRDEFSNGATYQGLHSMLGDFKLALMNKYEGMPVYNHKVKVAALTDASAPLLSTSFSLLVALITTAFYALY